MGYMQIGLRSTAQDANARHHQDDYLDVPLGLLG